MLLYSNFMKSIEERIMEKVIVSESGCWIFTGGKNKAGYGNIFVKRIGKRNMLTMPHRAMYRIYKGDIPEGCHICHVCDNPSCVNPDHLFAGTQKDNIKDMYDKNRFSQGKTHSERIKSGWTEEVRKKQSEFMFKRTAIEKKAKITIAGVPEDWKFCPTCNRWLSRDSFHLNKARYDGIHNRCRECRSTKH